MKKVVVIAHTRKTALQYINTLEELFKDSLSFSCYSLDTDRLTELDADIILCSTYSIYEAIQDYASDFNSIVIADLTLKKSSVDHLKSIPKGTRCYLANTSLFDSIDTIGIIYKYGIKNIDIVPLYPPIDKCMSGKIVITPGEMDIIPKDAKEIINLGDRVLSTKTITEIVIKLDMFNILKEEDFQNYFSGIIPTDFSTDEFLHQVNFVKQKLDFIIQVFDQGIISLDEDGRIIFMNSYAASCLKLKDKSPSNAYLKSVIPDICCDGKIKAVKNEVVNVGTENLIISVTPIKYTSRVQGYLVLLKKFDDAEKEQYRIRKQVMSKGHVAKYTFEDIIGESKEISEAKKMAKTIALSNSSVLIYGPTGTGKELFAQSIHNYSQRKDFPFIAINCAAIPENLLESELFGYSEGAFTGALKGGKQGYFEMANGGTLFLDEISEMNINLQTRLLRVLQEKEITRVGGDTIINVDVRIIAASNKKLKNLVSENKFRQDLYYRLNVFNLSIPELEKRKEDIPLIIEDMKKNMNMDFSITDEAMEYLKSLRFEGNIRELKNIVERMSYCESKVIDSKNIIKFLDDDMRPEFYINEEKRMEFDSFISENKKNFYRGFPILKILHDIGTEDSAGRKNLLEMLKETGNIYSEQEIRTWLEKFSSARFIIAMRGRGGSRITLLGEQLYNYIADSPYLQKII